LNRCPEKLTFSTYLLFHDRHRFIFADEDFGAGFWNRLISACKKLVFVDGLLLHRLTFIANQPV
jgi:hypothetical protein